MKVAAVMPFIVPEYKDACLEHCKLDNLLLVDNTVTNLGVMRSHNLGIDHMRDLDADWLVILSAAIRFAPDEGGRDFIRCLESTHADAHVVNAVGVYGWHLMAFSRETIETVGRWDENFYPYGFDDNDLAIRIHKALPNAAWAGVTVAVTDTIMAHSLKLGGVVAPAGPLLDYFRDKWGHRPQGQPFEAFNDHPFGDPANDVGYWPSTRGAEWDQPAP